MFADHQMLVAYIKKGQSEIHWDGKKKNHFDLITLIKMEYEAEVRSSIQRVRENYNMEKLRELIFSIDKNLPKEYFIYKLEDQRKELMFKLITLRLEKLFSLI